MEPITFGVLGPVTAWGDAGEAVALKGPRHRAVLARLITARRRVVPVARLVEDLWDEPGAGAVGAVRTFVADLRRVLEPRRPPRAPARLLVTEGPGYALRATQDAVDAWRFETAVVGAARLPPAQTLQRLDGALELWRGPAYAEFAYEGWARGERSRLAELRLRAVEQRAQAQLDLGLAAEAVPDLHAHAAEHPWREDGWRLLALALYRTGRQADALAVLRRARTMLAEQLGVDPGPALRRLETDILTQDPGLGVAAQESSASAQLWTQVAADYDRTVAAGARARLESTVQLVRNLAVTGGVGLRAAQEHRLAAVTAAEEFGDPDLTARVIGAYDVPAVWTRSDDPGQARQIVLAAERTLAALPQETTHAAARCRLLATVALEMRGTRSPRGPAAAREAQDIARHLDDPTLLAFALNGAFMQSCTRAGLAARRDAIGAQLVDVAARHGLENFEVLGRLIRMQACGALGDFAAADAHATAADRLAERHERPLVGVFTQWYGALRSVAGGRTREAEEAYEAAVALLPDAGMPGFAHGLPPLARLCLRLADGSTSARQAAEHIDPGDDWGPYRPWIEPYVPLRTGDRGEVADLLHAVPEPPADLLYEALCCLQAAVALDIGDRTTLERLHTRLAPAAGELAGAGSGLLTLGPVDRWLAAIAEGLDRWS
ncbi:AfsR/SARP family transcriptional regulator [Streptomyces sp. HGB0020]|uniref:AfsR/SARP family transcriptional regulator n=1 Tax=Streptomyces sp. HGB0020 TaxID=1078086 RepID=UPI00034EBD04|nr:BTAD domain-containing putative transcriptional regulator [Streptomyces sp. HGB0020]EPD63319.1 hypothetical protein HMPREF1211_03660 [Streptomyces sp. HGB0020]